MSKKTNRLQVLVSDETDAIIRREAAAMDVSVSNLASTILGAAATAYERREEWYRDDVGRLLIPLPELHTVMPLFKKE